MRTRLIGITTIVGALLTALMLSAAASGHGRGGHHNATVMKGRYEVPPGDPNGIGHALIRLRTDTSEVCWRLRVRRIEPATAAHIHRGERGVAGPVVVPLSPPTTGESRGCTMADPVLIEEIREHPSRFYVNVHNAEYPAGAVRGQLHGHHGHR